MWTLISPELAIALPFADKCVTCAAEYDTLPSDTPACKPAVTKAISLPPNPAADRHPTPLSDNHTVLPHVVAPNFNRAQPSHVPYAYPLIWCFVLPVVGMLYFVIAPKIGAVVENALFKKCDCTAKDIKLAKEFPNEGRVRHMTVVSLFQVVVTVELSPTRTLFATFIRPPWTNIKTDPVLEPRLGETDVMYGAS